MHIWLEWIRSSLPADTRLSIGDTFVMEFPEKHLAILQDTHEVVGNELKKL